MRSLTRRESRAARHSHAVAAALLLASAACSTSHPLRSADTGPLRAESITATWVMRGVRRTDVALERSTLVADSPGSPPTAIRVRFRLGEARLALFTVWPFGFVLGERRAEPGGSGGYWSEGCPMRLVEFGGTTRPTAGHLTGPCSFVDGTRTSDGALDPITVESLSFRVTLGEAVFGDEPEP